MATEDKNKQVVKLLDEVITDAGNIFANFGNLDTNKLLAIVRLGCYDPIVDTEVIIDEIYYGCIRFYDPKLHSAKLTPEQRRALVSQIHGKLSRIPIRYEVIFPLPEDYPFDNKQLLKNVKIRQFTEDEREKYIRKNPLNTLDQLIGRTENPLWPETIAYMVVTDSGLIRPANKIVLDNRHDPVRIFHLYIALHSVASTLVSAEYSVRQRSGAQAYDNKKFVANVDSSILSGSSLGSVHFRDEDAEWINTMDELFTHLLTERADKLEGVRTMLTNSLHWYFEFANSKDTNLRVVYLVSAFDSLFGFDEKHRVPTVYDIAPVVAEANASDFKEKADATELIKHLYSLRNEVIHGRKEIQQFRRIDAREKRQNVSTLNLAERQYKQYIGRQLRLYDRSVRHTAT